MNGKKAKAIRRMLKNLLPPTLVGTEQGDRLLKHTYKRVKNAVTSRERKND